MTNQGEIDAILAEAEREIGASAAEGMSHDPQPDHTDAAQDQASEASVEHDERGYLNKLPKSPPSAPKNVVITRDDVRRILSLEVPVIVRLAHRNMPVKEVMKFATGSIIEFDKAADAELDLMINNEVIGQGQAVKVGENFGLRVIRILSMKDKIAALGATRPKR